ncbi:MAG: ABC-F family ATP-binding cassette domain-containing protein [Planctomycetota bacterium]
MLRAAGITKSIAYRTLFRGISLSIDRGDRLGIVGPNGAGKSTLLKILAGQLDHDKGEVSIDPRTRTVLVSQLDTFEEGDTARKVVTRAGLKLAEERGEHIEEHEAEVTGDIILGKTGFPAELCDKDAATLSGGWRKRLAIAAGLASARDEPDLLFLDEPTNHLDIEGIRWLEQMVSRIASRGSGAAVAFVTHDRTFLERVSTRVAELSPMYPSGLLVVDGNYTEFLRRKQEFLAAQSERRRSLAGLVRKDIDWLSRGPQGRGTKAKGRIDSSHERMAELAELTERSEASVEQGSKLDFNAGKRKTRKMLVAEGVSCALGGKQLFTDVRFSIGAGDRLGLLGPNGSGKTTLIRVLTKQHAPDEGSVRLADPAPTVAVFSQKREEFPPTLRLRDALCPVGDQVVFRDRTIHVTGWARRFLFKDQQLEQPVGSLSGGELARVHVARIMLEPCDVLILDEPTNDLDIPSLETMEEALEDFPGALILVTHDQAMLDRLATTVLALDGKGNARSFASVDQAVAEAEERRRAEVAASKQQAKAELGTSAAPSKRNANRRQKLSFNEQRELDGIEAKIEQAELVAAEAESQMQATLADPKFATDHAKMAEVCKVLEAAQAEVKTLYDRWDELESKRARLAAGEPS